MLESEVRSSCLKCFFLSRKRNVKVGIKGRRLYFPADQTPQCLGRHVVNCGIISEADLPVYINLYHSLDALTEECEAIVE